MLLPLKNVLTRDQLLGAREILSRAAFRDGKLSAGMVASRVKHNLEANRESKEISQVDNLVMGSLVRHPDYRAGALPLKVAAPFYARYQPGMRYGDHVDDPVMGADGALYRTDVSITIFLNEPDEYDGGELVVRGNFGDQRVKMPAGDAVMYPSSSLHHVAEVTRGERLVAVTWVQSLIRDPAQRELLYELNRVREKMLADSSETEEAVIVNRAYVNLVRMWGDV
ncbi:MAG: nuclease PIN [Acidithiobacillales bacterium SM23_46]|jgi:PKHD-type hydroxylase|nr:MAG: nuclease PIN [Acidithiobacillales bacterium SM23_46]KPL27690.1 MAG: nuclease PIN [Acidithiobacillales bacterium SM1_46]